MQNIMSRAALPPVTWWEVEKINASPYRFPSRPNKKGKAVKEENGLSPCLPI